VRRVIGIGSALTLLVFTVALVVMLTPPPCVPTAAGRFQLCIPVNLSRGILVALVATALATLTGLVAVYHSLITQRNRYAALIGFGILTIAICFGVGLLSVTPIGGRAGNGVIVSPVFALAPLAILLSPLLAIVTLLYSFASPGHRPACTA
jgi:hypothetical protein